MTQTNSHPGSRTQATADSVLDLIISGTLATEGWLRETEIAKTLGVSRTPVRDALRELAGAGVVVIEQNRGARVKSYSSEEIEEVYRARAIIEPTVTAAAVHHLGVDEIDKMKFLAETMRRLHAEGGSVSEIARLNREFHGLLFANSGDHPLATTAENLLIPMIVTRVMHSYEGRKVGRSMDEHEDLITAIERRDPEWAHAIMKTHILAGLSSYKQYVLSSQ
ncbi:MAG: GntR family transcriptional regulator [Yaniella sp.]|uniref:GntR family transcriptional regulator n=1 Tax=Yaniella sp. TaxID=2773929 RepID=UPI003F96DF97